MFFYYKRTDNKLQERAKSLHPPQILRRNKQGKSPQKRCSWGLWSEMGDSNSRHLAPKPMSEPSGSPVAPSLALSGTPAVPF